MSDVQIRIVVVDDHEVVRTGVCTLLGAQPDIIVVGQAGSAHEALRVVETTHPDVVLMDVRLGDTSGIEATRDIRARCPQTSVIMLTAYADDDAALASLLAGAVGYVLKQVTGDEIVQGVRSVAAGQALLDRTVSAALFAGLVERPLSSEDERLSRLSPQERRILLLIEQGLTNKQIGEQLQLAEKTVKNHITRLLGKLEVARRADAAAFQTRLRLHPDA